MYVTATNPQSRTFVKAYHDILMSPALNPTDKLVYLTLLSYQEAGLQVFPSNDHVAKSLGLSKSTVIRSTGALEKAGLINKVRRFNNSNLITVNSIEVSKCNVQRCQSATSRGVKMTSYKNTDNNKDKISLKIEVQSQNIKSSLSQVNDFLDEPNLLDEDDFIGDKSVSDLKEISEENSLNKEEVINTHDSVPFQPDEDDEPLDDDLIDHDDSLPDFDDDDFSKTVYFDEDAAEKARNERDLFKTGLGRVTPTSRQKERAKYNRSQSYRSNPNY